MCLNKDKMISETNCCVNLFIHLFSFFSNQQIQTCGNCGTHSRGSNTSKRCLCHQEQILQRKDIQTSCLFSKRSHYISCWKKKIHSNLNWYLDYHRSLSTQVTLLACCLAEGETLEFMKTFFIKCEILGFPILNSPTLSTNAFNLSKPL